MERNPGIISENLKKLNLFFNTYNHLFEWYTPIAVPISFPKLKGEISISNFCEKLFKQEETMLLPTSVYGFNGNHFRIDFERKNLIHGLDRLESFINRCTLQ